MVDPINFTDYNRTDFELEEAALFSVLVTGKSALTTAKSLNKLLTSTGWSAGQSPFAFLKEYSLLFLTQLLRMKGIGCYNSKAKSIFELVRSKIDLRTCAIDELEKIHGIGQKTSRMFLLHTRPNVRCAALDTHILKYLADKGYEVPKNTPSSKKKYKELESVFLSLADKSHMSVADFDLSIWRKYSRNGI